MRKNTGKKEQYAYTIVDSNFGELKVLNTANAWWLDRIKLDKVIDSFKIGATIAEACVYAGISVAQYKYFKKLHPELSTIKDTLSNLPVLKARQRVVSGVNESYQNAMDYLKRKRKDEFGDSQKIDFDDVSKTPVDKFIDELPEEKKQKIETILNEVDKGASS